MVFGLAQQDALVRIANQQSDQADSVQVVCVGTSDAAVEFDARRDDYRVSCADVMQKAMEPKAAASGLVARDYCGAPSEIKPFLLSSDLPEDFVPIAGRHRDKTRGLIGHA
jgi:hypothetical protein